jgi:hypothetical protein
VRGGWFVSWKSNITKDFVGAVMLIVLGAGVVIAGLDYRMGTLTRMGAGFMPVVFGVLLIVVGLAMGLSAFLEKRAGVAVGPSDQKKHALPDFRGGVCIVGGVVAFVIVGRYGGLVPASFIAVFVAALGDRENRLIPSAILSAVLTLFCVLIFHFGLSLPFDLFQWG